MNSKKPSKKLLMEVEQIRKCIYPYKCQHGTYTNKFYGKECKPCGSPKTVLCDIKAGGKTSHSSKKCNPRDCEYFKIKQ